MWETAENSLIQHYKQRIFLMKLIAIYYREWIILFVSFYQVKISTRAMVNQIQEFSFTFFVSNDHTKLFFPFIFWCFFFFLSFFSWIIYEFLLLSIFQGNHIFVMSQHAVVSFPNIHTFTLQRIVYRGKIKSQSMRMNSKARN